MPRLNCAGPLLLTLTPSASKEHTGETGYFHHMLLLAPRLPRLTSKVIFMKVTISFSNLSRVCKYVWPYRGEDGEPKKQCMSQNRQFYPPCSRDVCPLLEDHECCHSMADSKADAAHSEWLRER